ncbi:unnamed protein product [Camellia sinensis]
MTWVLSIPSFQEQTNSAYSRSDYALLFFIVFADSAFLLLVRCTLEYQKLPPHEKSIKKNLLEFAIWFLFS